MASRLLTQLAARIAAARDPVEAACLRAQRSVYLARQGNRDEADAVVKAIREEFGAAPNAAVTAWVSLAEGLIRARTGFSVGSKSRMETAQLHCNEPLLRDLARESGGTYIAEEDIDSLVSSLEPLSKGHLMEAQHPLWNSPWWFVPIVLVLGAEWFLRKRAGLV